MASLTLTQAFNRLHTRDQQQQELRSLYDSLSKQHIRDLKALIEETEFRCDIIANLPVELVPLVFQHLDLYQSFQCRRVSQRWLELLSADQMVKALLQPWNATDNVKLRIPDGLSSKSVLDIHAEHQDAFRTGKAFSKVEVPHGQPIHDGTYTHAYSSGLLAWVERSDGCHKIYLYDLETSHMSYYVPPEREMVDEIAISPTLLVATTSSGRCYIWAHATTKPPYSLRLPSRCANVFYLTDFSFVLLQIPIPFKTSEPLHYESCDVLVGKLQGSSGNQTCGLPPQAEVSQFSARLLLGSSVMCWHDIIMDRTEQHIILSESVVNTTRCTHDFRILHYDIRGKVLFEDSLECPYSTSVGWSIHESSLTQKERFFEIWMVAKVENNNVPHQPRNGVQDTAVTHLKYFVDRRTLPLIEQRRLSHSHPFATAQNLEFFQWKGIGYFEEPLWVTEAEPLSQLRITDFRKERCVEACVAAPPSRELLAKMFLGDGIFLVKVTSSHFSVLCFDKNRSMAWETILRGKVAS